MDINLAERKCSSTADETPNQSQASLPLDVASCSAPEISEAQELSIVVENGVRYLKFSGIYNAKYPLEDFQCKFMGATLTAIHNKKLYKVKPLFSSIAQPSDQIEL